MSFSLLKFRDKRIRAKADCTLTRGRMLRGPRFEILQDGARFPLERARTGPSSRGLRPKGDFQPHWDYTTVLKSPGEEVDCDQVVARRLCVEENLATLVAGGSFSVIEQSDSIHLIELWYPPTQYGGPVHALFQPIEKIELLVSYGLAGGVHIPTETQIRVRSSDFFQACLPKDFLWQGEKADIPLPDGTGNSNHRFRILRPSPVSKAVALKQQEQSGMLRALWEKTFPGQPIGAAK